MLLVKPLAHIFHFTPTPNNNIFSIRFLHWTPYTGAIKSSKCLCLQPHVLYTDIHITFTENQTIEWLNQKLPQLHPHKMNFTNTECGQTSTCRNVYIQIEKKTNSERTLLNRWNGTHLHARFSLNILSGNKT